MRQVNHDELVWLLADGLRQLRPGLLKQLRDTRQAEKDTARFIAAQQLAKRLGRLEILSDAPEPPPFRWARIDGGSGVPPVES